MTRPELDGYTNALARLHGKKPSADDSTTKTRIVKSRREKKKTQRR